MRRNRIPIRRHYLKSDIRVGITYAESYTEASACVSAGLDYYKWRTDEYPVWFKGEVVAWYEMSGLIKAHTEAAKAKAQKKRAK